MLVEVPARFWQDHVERGLRCGEGCTTHPLDWFGTEPEYLGESTNRGVRVDLSKEDIRELLSDARHYSDYTRWGSPEGIGLQSSAQATIRRLEELQ